MLRVRKCDSLTTVFMCVSQAALGVSGGRAPAESTFPPQLIRSHETCNGANVVIRMGRAAQVFSFI